ncbi:nuclear transport factor 2 family protein [Jiangella mangrovi]|uniref:Ketosteroid isomerase-like protein n=1 Tax=Jiangella mangrovi TaxID=1524084 RepID=A0A7W9GRU1_9ACTN|nr:nuclear transport factor 2 family protein [Jiangella mangrovi]MBB5788880.1 ketosteroid isomerase-like protein [Jiangella mangrovi]
MSSAEQVVRTYFDALEAQDLATVAAALAEDVVWHQPGANRFSGVQRGATAVGAMIAGMTEISGGSFALTVTAPLLVNDDTVAAHIHFSASRDGATLDQDGIDVLKVTDGKISEVWLFSADQPAEDAFWG